LATGELDRIIPNRGSSKFKARALGGEEPKGGHCGWHFCIREAGRNYRTRPCILKMGWKKEKGKKKRMKKKGRRKKGRRRKIN
jgi:hypothetical protein